MINNGNGSELLHLSLLLDSGHEDDIDIATFARPGLMERWSMTDVPHQPNNNGRFQCTDYISSDFWIALRTTCYDSLEFAQFAMMPIHLPTTIAAQHQPVAGPLIFIPSQAKYPGNRFAAFLQNFSQSATGTSKSGQAFLRHARRDTISARSFIASFIRCSDQIVILISPRQCYINHSLEMFCHISHGEGDNAVVCNPCDNTKLVILRKLPESHGTYFDCSASPRQIFDFQRIFLFAVSQAQECCGSESHYASVAMYCCSCTNFSA